MAKSALTPETLCKSSRAAPFLDFAKNVFSLRFNDKPDYECLRRILVKALSERGMVPSDEYDWSPQKEVALDQNKQINPQQQFALQHQPSPPPKLGAHTGQPP